MSQVRVKLHLTAEAREWIPIAARERRDTKGKPAPVDVRTWCFYQLRQIPIRFSGNANRLIAKGYLIVRTGEEPRNPSVRLEKKDLHVEQFRPTGKVEDPNFEVELNAVVLDRLVKSVALLHLFIEKKIFLDEQFDTLEEWMTTNLTEAAADAFTEFDNRTLGEIELENPSTGPEPQPPSAQE